MVTEGQPRIVVGVSDSPSGRAALRWAARTAEERGASLELVRVWRDIGRLFSMTLVEARLLSDHQRIDRELLEDAEGAVHLMASDVPVTCDFLRGDLYDDLLARTAGVDLLVLGAGDPHGSSSNIGPWFQEHATCQVRIVQPERSDATR